MAFIRIRHSGPIPARKDLLDGIGGSVRRTPYAVLPAPAVPANAAVRIEQSHRVR